jgi:hypothetical protein
VDITVLRSGIPYTIPGRSTNFGEFGMGAMLAGELTPGDLIGVAFRVPEAETPIRTRALVRHQAKLHCGLSFVGLLPEQQMIIERWSRRRAVVRPPSRFETIAQSRPENSPLLKVDGNGQRYRTVGLMLAILLVAGSLGWWHWHRAWQDLESGIRKKATVSQQQRVQVPGQVMEQRLIHKVEPVLPEPGARRASGQDVVVLGAVIGTDGAVLKVNPLTGPDLLSSAAIDAVKWWKYEPYLVNGRPMEVETTVRVNFQASSGSTAP